MDLLHRAMTAAPHTCHLKRQMQEEEDPQNKVHNHFIDIAVIIAYASALVVKL